MTFLPIVARELRVTARKRSTYWIRFAAAALALVLSAWSFLFLRAVGVGNFAGQMLFGSLAGLAWLYAVIGGVFKTADSLSEEKREGTLGLLFLTDLKGYDIVLGKIVAASVNWFFGLIAIFPILALSLLMGGVAPGDFWRTIAALANLLFYSLALGMFVSSFMRSERNAAGVTVALLVFLLWLPSEASEWHRKLTGANEPSPWLVLPDVTRPLHYADNYSGGRAAEFYWGSLGVSHLIGWIYLLLASVIVPRTWQQQAGKLSRWQEKAEQLAYGKNRGRRRRFREHALALNPFYWVAARARGQSLMLLLVLLAITGYFAISYYMDPQDWRNEGSFLVPGFLLHGTIKFWIALAACRRFVEDRRSGALELILSTPLTEKEIIHGQWRALAQQFGVPILFVLAIDAVLLFLGWDVAANPRAPHETVLFAAMSGASIIIFLADVIALAWLSMWRGLKARHSYTAWLWSTVQVLALPWILFYVGLTAFMMLIYLPRFMNATAPGSRATAWNDWMPVIFTGMWFIASLATAVFTAWWANRCLQKQFRYQATLSYQPVKAGWSPRTRAANLPPRIAPSK